MTGDGATEPVPPIVTALAALLMRRCLGATQIGDGDAARVLARRLVEADAPAEILAVATGGVWAGFRPDGELDPDTLESVVEVTRAFLTTGGYDGLVALSSSALILMARRGFTSNPAADLVLAGQAAWELEHHTLALEACRDALLRDHLVERDRAIAMMLVARITGDSDDLTALAEDRSGWSQGVASVVDTRSLFQQSEDGSAESSDAGSAADWAAARDATLAGDRREAARLMAGLTRGLLSTSSRDVGFLDGLSQAFDVMTGQDIDVPGLRRGLIAVVRQLRQRQRFGNVPPAVRAALELVILIMNSAPSEATGSVLCELLEGLADAGISEVTLSPGGLVGPAEEEARLSEQAMAFPLWPDLEECVAGLEGNFALLCRRVGGGRSSAERWISLFVVPPDGVLIKSGPLVAEQAALMDAVSSGDLATIDDMTPADVESLLRSFVHSEAIRRLVGQPGRGLVIVPDGAQWTIPWQVAPTLASRPTTLTPSLSVYRALRSLAGPVDSVSALIDDTVDGADELLDELLAARSSGALEVDFAPASLGRPTDLLLVLCHGAGDGLRFEVSLPSGTTDALQIANRSQSRSAIIASCWSAKEPPVAMPLNLPVSLLMRGASHCLGGAWPLPQRSTAMLLVHLVRELSSGVQLVEALSRARPSSLGDSRIGGEWGLIYAGRIPPWHEGDSVEDRRG